MASSLILRLYETPIVFSYIYISPKELPDEDAENRMASLVYRMLSLVCHTYAYFSIYICTACSTIVCCVSWLSDVTLVIVVSLSHMTSLSRTTYYDLTHLMSIMLEMHF